MLFTIHFAIANLLRTLCELLYIFNNKKQQPRQKKETHQNIHCTMSWDVTMKFSGKLILTRTFSPLLAAGEKCGWSYRYQHERGVGSRTELFKMVDNWEPRFDRIRLYANCTNYKCQRRSKLRKAMQFIKAETNSCPASKLHNVKISMFPIFLNRFKKENIWIAIFLMFWITAY